MKLELYRMLVVGHLYVCILLRSPIDLSRLYDKHSMEDDTINSLREALNLFRP